MSNPRNMKNRSSFEANDTIVYCFFYKTADNINNFMSSFIKPVVFYLFDWIACNIRNYHLSLDSNIIEMPCLKAIFCVHILNSKGKDTE